MWTRRSSVSNVLRHCNNPEGEPVPPASTRWIRRGRSACTAVRRTLLHRLHRRGRFRRCVRLRCLKGKEEGAARFVHRLSKKTRLCPPGPDRGAVDLRRRVDKHRSARAKVLCIGRWVGRRRREGRQRLRWPKTGRLWAFWSLIVGLRKARFSRCAKGETLSGAIESVRSACQTTKLFPPETVTSPIARTL